MDDLLERLVAMRSELVGTMVGALAAEENWHEWLPFLGQVELAIRATRIVMFDALIDFAKMPRGRRCMVWCPPT